MKTTFIAPLELKVVSDKQLEFIENSLLTAVEECLNGPGSSGDLGKLDESRQYGLFPDHEVLAIKKIEVEGGGKGVEIDKLD